jgi:hypothetical protein
MKEYERLLAIDVIQPVERLIDQGQLDVDADSHIIPNHKFRFADHSWVHHEVDNERRCSKWMDVYWNRYRLISSGCFGCWKIVVTPETLKQLFAVHELQAKMDLPSKCGMERRPNTQGLYHGFWYAPLSEGLEGGRKLYKKIRKEMKQNGILNKVPIILKRA